MRKQEVTSAAPPDARDTTRSSAEAPPRARPRASSPSPLEASSRRRTGGRSRRLGCPPPRLPASRRLPADFRLDAATREADDERGHLADGMGPPAARVERLAPDLVAVERVGDREI